MKAKQLTSLGINTIDSDWNTNWWDGKSVLKTARTRQDTPAVSIKLATGTIQCVSQKE